MKLLFIGNSSTYVNDLPSILKGLLNENSIDSRVDSVTKGGRRLADNLESDDEHSQKLAELASKNEYDFLILQEHTKESALLENRFSNSVGALIKLVSPKKTILYSTLPRKEGHPELNKSGWQKTVDMALDVYGAYKRAAQKHGAILCPTSLEFFLTTQKYPEINLYAEDGAHPSYAASALAAISLYKLIAGTLPEKHVSIALDNETFKKLSIITDQTV